MIEVQSLTKHFGPIHAVNGVSFSVAKGEVLGFLGPNGAGKSTTMKMITGFLTPTSGSATICGNDIQAKPIRAKKHIGYLPEGAPLYADMTPAGFLGFIANVRGIGGRAKRTAIDRAIEMTQLGGVVGQPIETLSKGFKRRVGLAQALLHDPDVLILDEPTDGLDPNQKHDVRKIGRIAGAGRRPQRRDPDPEIPAGERRPDVADGPRRGRAGRACQRNHRPGLSGRRPVDRRPGKPAGAGQRLADRRPACRTGPYGRRLPGDHPEWCIREGPIRERHTQRGRCGMTVALRPGAVRTIFMREFVGYFATPVAYVFLIVFLALAAALTFEVGGWFNQGQADLGPFFTFHPWLYLFMIPAIAMRLWAEERHSGTVELLLTLPVSTGEAVFGKFLAAWVFAGVALALTFPMWITVNRLGSPDNGIILAGYIGSFLMAGGYLAISSFISAATKNQVIAFVLSAATWAAPISSWPTFRPGCPRRSST